jgi:hypothetical protein
MKFRIVSLAFLFAIFLFSCKKHKESTPQGIKNQVTGTWQAVKMETSGPTANGFAIIVDSSAYIKAFPQLMTSKKDLSPSNFNITSNGNKADEKYLKEILSNASYYNLKIILQGKYLLLQLNEYPPNPKRITTYYYEKAQ